MVKKKLKIKINKKSVKQKVFFVPKKINKIVDRKKIIKKPARNKVKALVAKKKKNNKTISKKSKKVIVKKKTIKKLAKKVIVKKIVLKKTKRHRPIDSTKKKKVQKNTSANEFPAETFFKARIKVIGIGGGGGSIVSEIGRSLSKATFMVADTDIRALKKKSGIKYFWFGQDLTHGLGTGVNIELGKEAAEQAKDKISENFKDQDIIIFIASLGGGLGSGATQVFAETARNFGGITFGIFTMPFKFEGKNKQRIALNALKSLRQLLNVSLVIPNEKIFKIISADTPITQAFSLVNKSLIESLESLIDLIYNPGIINIDFADLRTILKGTGNSAFLNTIEAGGKDRAEKICEKVFANPLLQNNSVVAEKILFNIAGADNLSMFEVEKISSHIASLNPKAKIIFGISKSSKLKNKLKTTILMTGGGVSGGEVVQEKSVKVNASQIENINKNKETSQKEAKKQEVQKNKVDKPKKNIKNKKEKSNSKKENNKTIPPAKNEKQISFVPVFKNPIPELSISDQKKMSITEINDDLTKKDVSAGKAGRQAIRRSGLEIKKAEEKEEKKKLDQEKEWEIPAFLRRVKYNK